MSPSLPLSRSFSTLSRANALYINLTSHLVAHSSVTFQGLVDSGSTTGFIDSVFVDKYAIPTHAIPPVKLHFLDGSSPSFLTRSVQIPIQFPSGEVVDKDFYVTLLDSLCAIVLGYNFLLQHNLLINWQAGTLNFPPSTPKEFLMHHPTPAPHIDTPE